MSEVCRTLALLHEPGPPALLVSLPANEPELALAAAEAGAQGLKVHLNMQHGASGTRFGSLDEEAAAISAVVAVGLPVGVVPGDAAGAVGATDVQRLAEMGLDYVDLYLAAMPAWLLQDCPLGLMAAIGHTDLSVASRLRAVAEHPAIQMIEASWVPHTGYGTALSAADVCDYTRVVEAMSRRHKPVVVPTQRAIAITDLPVLAAAGVRAILIGAVVTGADASGVAATTRRFRKALADLR
jgi:hypothetical protein